MPNFAVFKIDMVSNLVTNLGKKFLLSNKHQNDPNVKLADILHSNVECQNDTNVECQNDTNVECQNKEKSRSKSDAIQTKGQGQVQCHSHMKVNLKVKVEGK